MNPNPESGILNIGLAGKLEEFRVFNPFRISRRAGVAAAAIACMCILALGGCAVVEWPVKQVTQAVNQAKKPTLKQAVASLTSTDPDKRRESLNAIASYKDAKGAPVLIEIVGAILNGDPKENTGADKSQLVRAAAAETLGEIGESKVAVPILITALDNRENIPMVRQEVVRALGKIGKGDQRVIDKLLAVARSKEDDPDVRQEAANALGLAGDEKLLPELVALMKDEKRGELRVALGARDALQRLTGKPFGAEDPDVWLLWAEEGYNQEIVDRYVAGQLEMEKLRPTSGPVAEKIPDSVKRVFEGIGAELVLSGKSFVDGGARIASVPLSMTKLALKGPRQPLQERRGPGLVMALGEGVGAVGASLGYVVTGGKGDILYLPRQCGKGMVWAGRNVGRNLAKAVPGAKEAYQGISDGLEKVGKRVKKAFQNMFRRRDQLEIRTQSGE